MRKRRTSLHLSLVSPSKCRMIIIKDRNILLLTSSSAKIALFYVSVLGVLKVCKWGSHRLELLSHHVLLHIYFLSIFPHLQFQSGPMLFCMSQIFFCIPNTSAGPPFPLGILQPPPRLFTISCSVSKTQNPKYLYLELFSCHFRKLSESAVIETIWVVLIFH